MKKLTLDTTLIHAGEPHIDGSATLPIFQSSTYEVAGDAAYEDIRYGRMNNSPTHDALHEKIAAVCGGEAALVLASGMAAIATTMMTLLTRGDHLIVQDTLYGGTWSLVREDLAESGIEVSTFLGSDPTAIREMIRDNTKLIYSEAITNPLCEVTDHRVIVEIAREKGITTAIDNTFASPVNFRPLELGYDLSLHSATKYLNGHTDLIAGVVVGSTELVASIRKKMTHLGGSLNPISSYFLYRGMKTLALRIKRHNENAMHLANALDGHSKVIRVHYPGLESNASHRTATELFCGTGGGYGGMLSFELDGGERKAIEMMGRLELAYSAPSLGGLETLISRPATSSHAGLPPDERRAAGITDGLIRISTGIESADDLTEDFLSALEES